LDDRQLRIVLISGKGEVQSVPPFRSKILRSLISPLSFLQKDRFLRFFFGKLPNFSNGLWEIAPRMFFLASGSGAGCFTKLTLELSYDVTPPESQDMKVKG
jgi:hypothetical protein